jgi:hypothetical protein
MSLGFNKIKRPSLDLKGIETQPIEVSPAQEQQVIQVAERLGFISRENGNESKGGGVVRHKKREIQRNIYIKGPASVIDQFIEYTNRNGFDAYWQALAKLLDSSKKD